MKQLKRRFLVFILEQVIFLAKKFDIKDNLLCQGLKDVNIWIARERKR